MYLGAILVELVKHFKDLKITALVRNKDHEEAVRKLGVEVVPDRTHCQASRTADLTVNAAISDEITPTLAGQKARVVEDEKKPAVWFPTSGGGRVRGKREGRKA